MSKKLKFKPKITRIKLNPEQAVLTCYGYNTGKEYDSGHFQGTSFSAHCEFGGGKNVFSSNEWCFASASS